MINSAKIFRLCNDIEDIVTDLDVHCTQAGWAECMEIFTKIKQIGEELKETQARWITIDSKTAKCPCCGWWQRTKMYYLPDDIPEFSKCYRFCTSCGTQMDGGSDNG